MPFSFMDMDANGQGSFLTRDTRGRITARLEESSLHLEKSAISNANVGEALILFYG